MIKVDFHNSWQKVKIGIKHEKQGALPPLSITLACLHISTLPMPVWLFDTLAAFSQDLISAATMSGAGLSYGLNITKKQPIGSRPAPGKRKPIFDEDNDSGGEES